MNHQNQELRSQLYAELKLGNKEYQIVIMQGAGLILRHLQKLLKIYSKRMRLRIKTVSYKKNSRDQFAK